MDRNENRLRVDVLLRNYLKRLRVVDLIVMVLVQFTIILMYQSVKFSLP
jgi:hypothetical protein